MGSVPRINYPLANVSWPNVLRVHGPLSYWISKMSLYLIFHSKYDKLSKGVSILSHQLPYTLQLA